MLIEYLKGLLVEHSPGYSIVETSGVGYGVETMPLDYSHFPKVGSEVFLYIHYHLHEDSRAYYGFLNRRDRDIFTLMLSVSGIGPKLASKAFAEHSASQLISWIRNGEEAKLRSVKGIGPKLAGKIIIDLKDKAARFALPGESPSSLIPNQSQSELELALAHLGYKDVEIRMAVAKIQTGPTPQTLETSIRLALQILSKR
jgi:Holliday junction DNA helicase RuvA